VSAARGGGRIGCGGAATGDRQGTVLRAGEVRRDPGDRSGGEGRCTFPVRSGRQDQFAGWIPFRGPEAGAGRAVLAPGGASSLPCSAAARCADRAPHRLGVAGRSAARPRLYGYGFALEQALQARRPPDYRATVGDLY
jgi:hypothetical protein